MSRRSLAGQLTLLCVTLGLLSCSAKTVDPRAGQFAKLPDWRGIWATEGLNTDISGYPPEGESAHFQLMGGAGPWTPAQKTKIDAMMPQITAALAKSKATGWGYPLMMESFAPMEFLITPEQTLIINLYRDVRHIYTDGRPHPAAEDRWPMPWGDSVGHWEGDTLVIDTVSVQRPGIFVPFPLVSEQARYIERLRKTGPDRIESEMTIEDPATLTKPWVIKLAYLRQPAIDRMFHNAFDNDRVVEDGDTLKIAPPKR
jgi:hypothetical protein